MTLENTHIMTVAIIIIGAFALADLALLYPALIMSSRAEKDAERIDSENDD